MFRFFRHILEQLMEQNKVRAYFLYAAGVILLVVIGILFALFSSQLKFLRQSRAENCLHLLIKHLD